MNLVEPTESVAGGGAAIELRGLKKAYGKREVLAGVDLRIEAGTILGYVGANGAGKSTTIKILCGLLDADGGEVCVLGLDPHSEPLEVKRRIGYVPENAVLYENLTVAEHLLFVGNLHGLPEKRVRVRGEVLLEVLGLRDRLSASIGTLSKGMRQKLLLATALLHDPDVLLLDEPLSGLDVNAVILVKDLLRRLADEGRTIFYCSHVMDVVERVCDRIAILADGRVLAEGTFEELSKARGGGSLEHILAGLGSTQGREGGIERLIAALRRRDDAKAH